MIVSASIVPAFVRVLPRVLPRGASAALWSALAIALSGCADMSDSMNSAFADPAQYDLYDCKQLDVARRGLANRAAELQGLMAKAETGTGGAVVSELAYRNDYVAVRGQMKFADDAWRRSNCKDNPTQSSQPVPPTRPVIKPAAAPKSGGAVH
jgi:hypothetical protein